MEEFHAGKAKVSMGTKVFEDYDLNEIYKYLDWQPFFIAWEMHGKFPQILSDEKVGVAATKLYDEAQDFS